MEFNFFIFSCENFFHLDNTMKLLKKQKYIIKDLPFFE